MGDLVYILEDQNETVISVFKECNRSWVEQDITNLFRGYNDRKFENILWMDKYLDDSHIIGRWVFENLDVWQLVAYKLR